MLIPVILSGGAGVRLWPASRASRPKPFLRIGGGPSLIERTLLRALAVATPRSVLTVTHRDHLHLTREAYAPHATEVDCDFVLEPFGRNTAPALALAALRVAQRFGQEAILLVLPADHLIDDLVGFSRDVGRARQLAERGLLVTFGIAPRHPETGFGYILRGAPIDGLGHEVARFVEKPDAATAAALIASGEAYWNGGMFCLRADSLLDGLARHAPAVLAAARAAHADAPTDAPWHVDAGRFAESPDVSFDHALMEHADNRAVVPAGFDWDDIGSWAAVGRIGEADVHGNRLRGEVLAIDSRDCFAESERLLALVGVEDLIVVDSGDAVLVSHRERSQQVRRVVEQLKLRRHLASEVHRTVHRPWGRYTVLEDAPDCKVKRLVVDPGQILSLQLHHRRSEHWTVVDGTARVTVGERTFPLHVNESVMIPAGTRHRLENPGSTPIALIEVQCGDYFGEDDIVRFEDRYGRPVAGEGGPAADSGAGKPVRIG